MRKKSHLKKHNVQHLKKQKADAGIIAKNQTIIGGLLFVFSLFLVVTLLQTPQTIRQNAQTAQPSTPPQCAAINGFCYDPTGCTSHTPPGIDNGAKDCTGGATCCTEQSAPQCQGAGGDCKTSSDCSSAGGSDSGVQDCSSGSTCCMQPGSSGGNPTVDPSAPVPSSTVLGDCQSNGTCPTLATGPSGAPVPGLPTAPAPGANPNDFMGQLMGLIHQYFPNSNAQVSVNSGSKGPCFIATAAYGTPVAKDVRYLRAFRDEYLLTNGPGTLFVNFYYTVSPPIASELSKHDGARSFVRTALMPLVSVSKWIVSPQIVDQYK